MKDSSEIAIANTEEGQLFDVKKDSLIIPYGDYPHPRGLQKFSRDSAQSIARAWNEIPAAQKKCNGIPIYIGHPDVPELRKFYRDTKSYGWVDSIHAANDAMTMPVKWTAAGGQLIDNGHFKFYSPFWMLKKVPGGISPTRLKSIGLTNTNNIPVPALANEKVVDVRGKFQEIAAKNSQIRNEAVKEELAKLAKANLTNVEKYNLAWHNASHGIHAEAFQHIHGERAVRELEAAVKGTPQG